jgi:two-component system NtrC family sensor kinase
MIKPLLDEQAIAAELDVHPVPPVYCDPVVLHQIVLNVVLNARDAMMAAPSNRARQLRVNVRHDADTVRLTIADTGPGISDAVRTQLFQPFVTTKGDGHVGLGLAAAHASLKHVGGQIEATNVVEGGAVFTIVLRAARDADSRETIAVTDTDGRRATRILAVDDDPDIVDVVRIFLEPLGFEVAVASEPEQALRVAAEQQFDVILCDVGLPKRSGLDVCHELREQGFAGKLVLMTGWDARAVLADKRVAGCDRVLKKPFLGTDLLQVVTSLVVS